MSLTRTVVWSALLLALGLVGGGALIGHGFQAGRAVQRHVTVKGLAQRDVRADLALWPIRFVSTADDLARAQRTIAESEAAIRSFLARYGLDSTHVELQHLEVTDALANPYRSGPATSRYVISQSLMVRSEDPERVRHASQDVGVLVDAGVVLSSSGGPGGGPTYLFTRLNDLKPEMIAEATRQARRAAEQFAEDSGSRLGKILRANQGVFVIRPRDRAPGIREESQMNKTVRVVSTIDYLLSD